MARTTRAYMTERNYREARGGKVRTGPFGWEPKRDVRWAFRYGGPSRRHGGMLMSPSNTGMWGDAYAQGDKRTKRAIKRSERARALREAVDDS